MNAPDRAESTPISGFPECLPGDRHRRAALPRRHPRDLRAARLRLDRDPRGRADRAAVQPGRGRRQGDLRVSRLGRPAPRTTGREGRLGLHFDLTVPFARYVLENAGKLQFPFRRYQIQKVWRGERPQEGRYREFTQADIDIVDAGTLAAALRGRAAAGHRRRVQQAAGRAVPDPGQQPQDPRGLLPRPRPDRRRDASCGSSTSSTRSARPRSAALLVEAGATDDAGRRAAWRWPRSPRTDAVVRRPGARPRRRAPALDEGLDALAAVDAGRDASTRPGLLVADLRIARGLDYYTGTVYETQLVGHESSARSAPAAATTRWPRDGRTTYPGVGHLDRRVPAARPAGRPQGAVGAAGPTPTCVLVAVADEEDRAAGMRVAAAAAAAGDPRRGGPGRGEVRQADPLRRAARHPVRLVPRRRASRRPGQGHPLRRAGRRGRGDVGPAGGRPAPARRRAGRDAAGE